MWCFSGGFLFEGLSDDEDDFQSVSMLQQSPCCPAGPLGSLCRLCCLCETHHPCSVSGQRRGLLPWGWDVGGHASGDAGPQRGSGPAPHHSERAGQRPGPGQHPREQRRHPYNQQPGSADTEVTQPLITRGSSKIKVCSFGIIVTLQAIIQFIYIYMVPFYSTTVSRFLQKLIRSIQEQLSCGS